MLRLTRPRVIRWSESTSKMHYEVNNLMREVAKYRMNAAGGRYADLTDVEMALKVCAEKLKVASDRSFDVSEKWQGSRR